MQYVRSNAAHSHYQVTAKQPPYIVCRCGAALPFHTTLLHNYLGLQSQNDFYVSKCVPALGVCRTRCHDSHSKRGFRKYLWGRFTGKLSRQLQRSNRIKSAVPFSQQEGNHMRKDFTSCEMHGNGLPLTARTQYVYVHTHEHIRTDTTHTCCMQSRKQRQLDLGGM